MLAESSVSTVVADDCVLDVDVDVDVDVEFDVDVTLPAITRSVVSTIVVELSVADCGTVESDAPDPPLLAPQPADSSTSADARTHRERGVCGFIVTSSSSWVEY